MARAALVKAGTPQVVERRRNAAIRVSGQCRRRSQVGMALEADETLFMPRQHPRIRRPVRLVTGRAAFQFHRRMLERERTSLVTMALEAARLIAVDCLELLESRSAMGVVAVHTGHRAFRHWMMMRTLELGNHA